MRLSKHFERRWKERVGELDPKIIVDWVRRAPVVQKYRKLATPRGRTVVILELRFLPEIGAIVKLDAQRNTLVTVITKETM